jgi:hypothetical protein
MIFAISDTVLVAIIGGVFALMHALVQAYLVYISNKTHKSVNSTALVLAKQKERDEAKALERESEIGRLKGIIEQREH